jgi:hypothetical protein
MSWNVSGIEYPTDFFGSFEPVDILYDFDGPRIFTTNKENFGIFLAYQCAEDADLSRYIVVPANNALVDALRAGHATMRDALHQPWMWLVDRRHSGEIARARKIDFHELPEGALPRPGVLLLPSLRPVLSIRMVGAGLGASNVPASVIRRAVEGATTALKFLVEWVLKAESTGGRPEDRLRRYYDLPVQRVAFASFEIAFAPPPQADQASFIKDEEEALNKIGELLQKGLEWASSSQEESLSNNQESFVILEALAKLIPPRHGVVTEVHLGGRLAGPITRPRVLTRASSERVRKALTSIRADVHPVKMEGFVREFDKDKRTFTLRDADGNHMGRCSVPEIIYDDALAAFDGEYLTTVLGHESKARGIIDVLSIAPTPIPETVA